MIVRLLLWNLADSKTSLDELRPRLQETGNRTWISEEATERFGVIELWEGEPGAFSSDLLELIGKNPDVVEQFDVEG